MPNESEETIGFDLLAETITIYVDDDRATLRQHIDKALAACVAATIRMGKPAKFALAIAVRPGGEENAVEFVADVQVTVPRPSNRPVQLYGDKAGKIYGDNPRQGKLAPFTRAAESGGER